MNSVFSVTDISAFSPLDLGTPSMMRVPNPDSHAAHRRKDNLSSRHTQDSLTYKLFVEPKLHGRRVDPASRMVSPEITHLPLQPHVVRITARPMRKGKYRVDDADFDDSEPLYDILREKRIKRQADRAHLDNSSDSRSRDAGHSRINGARILLPGSGPPPAKMAAMSGNNGAAANGGPPKQLKVLRPIQSSSPLSNQMNGERPHSPPGKGRREPASSGKDTALVRLSSGKVVRVPLDCLKQIPVTSTSAKSILTSSTVTTTTTTATKTLLAAASSSTPAASKPPATSTTSSTPQKQQAFALRTDPTTLAKALEQISAAPNANQRTVTRVVLPTMKPGVNASPQQILTLSSAKPTTVVQPNLSQQQLVVQNGGAQKQVVTLSGSEAVAFLQQQQQQKVVRIRAIPAQGSPIKPEGQILNTQPTTLIPVSGPPPVGSTRLSEQLSTLVPVSSTVMNSVPGNPPAPGVISLPRGAIATPVRIKYIQHPGQSSGQVRGLVSSSSSSSLLQVTNNTASTSMAGSNTTIGGSGSAGNGIKLSMALNSVSGGERLIVLSPKVPMTSSSASTGATAKVIGQQHVQLAPVFSSSMPPGTVRKVIQLPTAPVPPPASSTAQVVLPKAPTPLKRD